MRCADCQWWVQLPANFNRNLVTPLISVSSEPDQSANVSDYGQCRRKPPSISTRDVQDGRRKWKITFSEFPDTPKDAWCGEFLTRAQGMEARQGQDAKRLDPKDESQVAKGDAP